MWAATWFVFSVGSFLRAALLIVLCMTFLIKIYDIGKVMYSTGTFFLSFTPYGCYTTIHHSTFSTSGITALYVHKIRT